MPKKTSWQVFRDFHNSHKIGDVYTRQDIFTALHKEGFKMESISNTTVDCYRNMCMHCKPYPFLKMIYEDLGFGTPVRVGGRYQVLNLIPDNWSSKKLRTYYDEAPGPLRSDVYAFNTFNEHFVDYFPAYKEGDQLVNERGQVLTIKYICADQYCYRDSSMKKSDPDKYEFCMVIDALCAKCNNC